MKFRITSAFCISLLGSSALAEDCCSTTSANNNSKSCDKPCALAKIQNFDTIPNGGWSSYVTVVNGLEYLYASPCSATDEYFDYFPQHHNAGSCSSNNFPDCVRNSGFRLPTDNERAALLGNGSTPPCMSPYTDASWNHCDGGDYGYGKLVTQTDTTASAFWETVYVRPVNTPDSCDDRPTPRSTKSPTTFSTKSPTPRKTKSPTLPSTKSPTPRKTKSPTLPSTKSPTPRGTKSPSAPPTSPPTPPVGCVNSPRPFKFNGKSRKCKWVEKRKYACNFDFVESHCPKTCDACDMYGCEDSMAKFAWKRTFKTCKKINIGACKRKHIMKTCRAKCGLCE